MAMPYVVDYWHLNYERIKCFSLCRLIQSYRSLTNNYRGRVGYLHLLWYRYAHGNGVWQKCWIQQRADGQQEKAPNSPHISIYVTIGVTNNSPQREWSQEVYIYTSNMATQDIGRKELTMTCGRREIGGSSFSRFIGESKSFSKCEKSGRTKYLRSRA